MTRFRGFVGVCCFALLLAALGTPAHATIGTCDTAGPIEVEGSVLGTTPTAYATLAAAITAINGGTHTGVVEVEVCASSTETAAMFLNSSGAGSASYTSLRIRPLVDGVTISGPTVTGRGLIELNGADNVTIDGDNPNSGGTNRNLTIANTATATIVANSVIRIATVATTVTSADNITIKNLIINGNVTGGNSSLITSTTGSSGISFGIFAGGGATAATTAPAALTAAAGTAA
ncbi:MAG TPA: hypothetical protein VJ826_04810, partial [Candidatus Polarisedimenticolaceae bacterium]|nr:hypothetical protein [Candidatus Polarisedimenticolaceae bacterium]